MKHSSGEVLIKHTEFFGLISDSMIKWGCKGGIPFKRFIAAVLDGFMMYIVLYIVFSLIKFNR